jgi:hypothetical protein
MQLLVIAAGLVQLGLGLMQVHNDTWRKLKQQKDKG